MTIFEDISIYTIPNTVAEEQLAILRHVFLSLFPILRIRGAMAAMDIRLQPVFSCS